MAGQENITIRLIDSFRIKAQETLKKILMEWTIREMGSDGQGSGML